MISAPLDINKENRHHDHIAQEVMITTLDSSPCESMGYSNIEFDSQHSSGSSEIPMSMTPPEPDKMYTREPYNLRSSDNITKNDSLVLKDLLENNSSRTIPYSNLLKNKNHSKVVTKHHPSQSGQQRLDGGPIVPQEVEIHEPKKIRRPIDNKTDKDHQLPMDIIRSTNTFTPQTQMSSGSKISVLIPIGSCIVIDKDFLNNGTNAMINKDRSRETGHLGVSILHNPPHSASRIPTKGELKSFSDELNYKVNNVPSSSISSSGPSIPVPFTNLQSSAHENMAFQNDNCMGNSLKQSEEIDIMRPVGMDSILPSSVDMAGLPCPGNMSSTSRQDKDMERITTSSHGIPVIKSEGFKASNSGIDPKAHNNIMVPRIPSKKSLPIFPRMLPISSSSTMVPASSSNTMVTETQSSRMVTGFSDNSIDSESSSNTIPISAPVSNSIMPVSDPVSDSIMPISDPVSGSTIPFSATVNDSTLPVSSPVSGSAIPISAPLSEMPVGTCSSSMFPGAPTSTIHPEIEDSTMFCNTECHNQEMQSISPEDHGLTQSSVGDTVKKPFPNCSCNKAQTENILPDFLAEFIIECEERQEKRSSTTN